MLVFSASRKQAERNVAIANLRSAVRRAHYDADINTVVIEQIVRSTCESIRATPIGGGK